MKSKHIGSSFDDFLKEKGIREEANGQAIKRLIAWQLAEAMKAKKISKAEMARRLKTSRTQIARFLDPDNRSVQFGTMQTAAASGRNSDNRERLARFPIFIPRLKRGSVVKNSGNWWDVPESGKQA